MKEKRMSNTEKIDYLLLEVKRLEELLAGVRDAEIYPVSFFDQSFDLAKELLKELYSLEAQQVDALRKQMEARQARLQEILLLESQQTSVVEEINPVATVQVEKTEEFIPPVIGENSPGELQEEIITQALQETAEELIEESVTEEPIREEKTIEELLREYAPPQPLVPEKGTVSLSEVLEKKKLTDFKKAFSLIDRFYFLRELFEGDNAKMDEAISDLNEIDSFEGAMDYLNNKMRWNPEDEAVANFIQLLEKRFL